MEAIGEQLAEFGSTAGTLPRVGPRGRRPFDTHNVGRRPGRLSHLPARPAPTDPPIADAPKVGTPGAGTPNPDQGPADHSDSGAAETGPAETGAAGTDPVTLPAEDPLGLASLGELLAAATAAAPDALASADNAEEPITRLALRNFPGVWSHCRSSPPAPWTAPAPKPSPPPQPPEPAGPHRRGDNGHSGTGLGHWLGRERRRDTERNRRQLAGPHPSRTRCRTSGSAGDVPGRRRLPEYRRNPQGSGSASPSVKPAAALPSPTRSCQPPASPDNPSRRCASTSAPPSLPPAVKLQHRRCPHTRRPSSPPPSTSPAPHHAGNPRAHRTPPHHRRQDRRPRLPRPAGPPMGRHHRRRRYRTHRRSPPPHSGRLYPQTPPRPAPPRNLRHHRPIRLPHHRHEHRH